MKKHLFLLITALTVILTAGCEKDEPVLLAGWTVEMEPSELREGDQFIITVTSPLNVPVTIFFNSLRTDPEEDFVVETLGQPSPFQEMNYICGALSPTFKITDSWRYAFTVPEGTIRETHEGVLKLGLVNMGDYYTGENSGGNRVFYLPYKLVKD